MVQNVFVSGIVLWHNVFKKTTHFVYKKTRLKNICKIMEKDDKTSENCSRNKNDVFVNSSEKKGENYAVWICSMFNK